MFGDLLQCFVSHIVATVQKFISVLNKNPVSTNVLLLFCSSLLLFCTLNLFFFFFLQVEQLFLH